MPCKHNGQIALNSTTVAKHIVLHAVFYVSAIVKVSHGQKLVPLGHLQYVTHAFMPSYCIQELSAILTSICNRDNFTCYMPTIIILFAVLYVICCNLYVLSSILSAICPDRFMPHMCPYVACLNPCMMYVTSMWYASIHP